MGILYIVPTPVGNMEDMTLRAIRILKEADVVLAEDTRTSGILLKHFGIQQHLMSHHKFNEHGTTAGVIERLKAGQTVALISDAGTPGISDPGFFRIAVRPLLLRRFPAPEERPPDPFGVVARRAAHYGVLRVALPPLEDPPAVGRAHGRRPPSERLPRNIESPRRERPRHTRRSHRPFHPNRATRRNRHRAGRMRKERENKTK